MSYLIILCPPLTILSATVIRNASHLPSILSPQSSSPTYPSFNQQNFAASRAFTPSGLTYVILVPLSDSPALPSLSLLLAQGTTPTAVCFQQDLLERAKRTEDEWLPFAVEKIMNISEMRYRVASSNQQTKAEGASFETPIILAYSANPALSPSTIAACVDAGASGVLKPPYDFETAKLVRRMVRAAREGRISSVVGLPNRDGLGPMSPTLEEPQMTVVLPPTALRLGGEHEGEKVLSAAVKTHARGMSEQWISRTAFPAEASPGLSVTLRGERDIALFARGGDVSQPLTGPTHEPRLVESSFRHPAEQGDPYRLGSLYRHNPAYDNRRRSVDVSGLRIALGRAQRAFEAAAAPDSSKILTKARLESGYSFPATPTKPGRQTLIVEDADNKDTELAELLSAMYYQTTVAIQIQMSDYSE